MKMTTAKSQVYQQGHNIYKNGVNLISFLKGSTNLKRKKISLWVDSLVVAPS